MTFDSPPPDSLLLDISYFANFRKNEFMTEYLQMPIREVASYFPADFRTTEEWHRDIAKVHG